MSIVTRQGTALQCDGCGAESVLRRTRFLTELDGGAEGWKLVRAYHENLPPMTRHLCPDCAKEDS